MLGCCGHDCSRCVTYLATIKNDDALRKQSQQFYKTMFGLDIPLDEVNCLGCQSNNVFKLCKSCPFTKCVSERKIAECSECVEYPCKVLAEYQEKYVNKCNQIKCDCGNGINEQQKKKEKNNDEIRNMSDYL